MTEDSVHFFNSPAEFGKWLRDHHKKDDQVWVGFYKKHTGKPTLTWPESVEQALMYGWIDGIRKTIDDSSYKIRFTPRRKGSIWSAVNIKIAEALIAKGRMKKAGLDAFAARTDNKSRIYSFEQDEVSFTEAEEKLFKADKTAFRNFNAMAPSYRKVATWWVISAKRADTRVNRMAALIGYSREGTKIPSQRRPGDKK